MPVFPVISRFSRLIAPLAAVIFAFLPPPAHPAEAPRFLEEGKTVVFLGDSITAAGTYIAHLDTYLFTHFPEKTFHLINLGLSSGTASGDSEPDHPFPRPCIHDRLDRVIMESKPDVTFVCYGMNDGIYYPFGEDRFRRYQEGVLKLIAALRAAGSKVILLTPPPFDAETRRLKGVTMLPEGAPEYGFKTAFQDYDDVLKKYGEWILSLEDEADLTIDIHTPMHAAIDRMRAADPEYQSGDGIHPNAGGHFVMARTILEALEAPGVATLPDYADLPPDHPLAPALKEILVRRRLLSGAWREHVGHSRPGKNDAPPLKEAQAKAAALEDQIRKLLAPSAAEK